MQTNFYTFLRHGFSQVQRYGLKLLYWRYIHRWLILFEKPIFCPPDSHLEIHMQVCARDWLNGLWTLSSFYYFSNKSFRLVLLHDGWLNSNKSILNIYKRHFPGIIVYNRQDLISKVKDKILPIAPTIANMWLDGRYFTLAKVVDSFLLCKNRYYLSVDPDVLFFKRPVELLSGMQTLNGTSACWNFPIERGHADGMFCFSPDVIQQLTGLTLPVPFGTGLGCVDSFQFDWETAESVFSQRQIPENLMFMVDQTLFALFAAKNGFVALPRNRYAIEPVSSLNGVVARHYYSKTRDLMYLEGISYLTHKGLIKGFCQSINLKTFSRLNDNS